MAARRLLIVMLVLLGLSTLAAALVPQRTLNDGDTTRTTTTQAPTTTAVPNPAFLRPTKITVGGKKFPIVSPVHVGSQVSLLVRSRFPSEIAIPEFGLIGFATPNTPARFALLADAPGTFGIVFGSSAKAGVEGKTAARIVVVQPGAKEKKRAAKPKKKKGASSRAPAGSDQA